MASLKSVPPLRVTPLLCLTVALALFGAGCSRSNSSSAEAKAGKKGEAGKKGATAEHAETAPPVAVTTARAESREVPSYVQATGSLVAEETSDVASQSSGQVVSTPVNVGAFVRQGDVVARLNDRAARLRLQQAQAGVSEAVAAVRQAEAR